MTDDSKFAAYQSPELRARFSAPRNLALLWENAARAYADAPCVRQADTALTYREMNERVERFRGRLSQMDLKRGDTVCMTATGGIDFIKAFLAVQTLGLRTAVLPPLPPESLTGITRQFGAALTLCDAKSHARLKEAGINAISTADDGSEKAPPRTLAESEEIALIIFTGGTSGKPKGALLSNRCVCEGVVNGCYGYNPVFGQKYLLALPLFHVFGLIRSVLTPLYTGSEIIISASPKEIFNDMQAFSPTIAVLVPLLVERGVTLSRAYGRNMFGNALRCIITGAAPLAEHLGRECAEMGITLCPGYGLTETACLVSGNPDILRKPGSVGLLFPNQEVRFVDGELWLRGKNLFSGYTDPAETENAFTDGWFRTGDAARLDEDGFLYIMGRKKEMLLTANGENVYPAEVEALFNVLPEVQESQLYVTRDTEGHEMLALEVLPRARGEGDETLMRKLKEINSTLPGFCRAKRITLRENDFERTASLKMKRYPQMR